MVLLTYRPSKPVYKSSGICLFHYFEMLSQQAFPSKEELEQARKRISCKINLKGEKTYRYHPSEEYWQYASKFRPKKVVNSLKELAI